MGGTLMSGIIYMLHHIGQTRPDSKVKIASIAMNALLVCQAALGEWLIGVMPFYDLEQEIRVVDLEAVVFEVLEQLLVCAFGV